MVAMPFDLAFKAGGESSGVLLLTAMDPHAPSAVEVPLRFVETGEGVTVLSRKDEPPRWAVALLASRRATWRIGSRRLAGRAERVEDPSQLARSLDAFRERFGLHETDRWFGAAVLGFRLVPHADSLEDAGDLEAYFDRLAPAYDEMVQSNPLDLHLRSVAGDRLRRTFRPGQRVLEIGCGTGIETLPLARLGVQVVATDVSGAMLTRLMEKAAAEGLSPMIETRRLDARDPDTFLESFGPAAFDGAFSDFGALNCEANLGTFPRVVHDLLRPGGPLVLGIWNRYCASEAMLALAGRNPRKALSRLQSPVAVGASRFGIPVFARGPREFLLPFRPYFEAVGMTGLPVFLPPYDFGAHVRERSELFELLRRLDVRLAGRFPFNRVGDHFLVVLRRRP